MLMFQEQRTSHLPLELDQITDDSAATRLDVEIKSTLQNFILNRRSIAKYINNSFSFLLSH